MGVPRLTASYVKSINGSDKITGDNRPKVVFLGRSNVGKSSLINSLVGSKIARSSSQPGKTVTIDFFLVENALFFVDLPGYGYAKRSRDEQEHYRKLIAWYLFRSGVVHKLIVLIVDAKVGITDYDRESIELLSANGIPFIIVANKIDKLKQNERAETMKSLSETAGGRDVLAYSSETGEGRDALVRMLTG